jgi:protein required for attachment to host cells
MLIPHDTLVMTLDGGRMMLYRNVGDVSAPTLKLLEQKELNAPSTAALGDDGPGRTFQSAGSSRAAYEATDLHQKSEDLFVDEMAKILASYMKQTGQSAILIAPARVSGQVREHLTLEVRSRLIGELSKDYTGKTALELVDLLDRHES